MKRIDILRELEKKEPRWNVFIDKTITHLDEFCVSAKKELTEAYQADQDQDKKNYGRFLASVKGQMTLLRKKVDTVNNEELQKLISKGGATIPFDCPEYDDFSDLVARCLDKLQAFEDKWDNWFEEFENVSESFLGNDLESKYKSILDEYSRIKNQFKCRQCGSSISIDKIFFTSTYVECPVCSTQNTFEPSSQAEKLLHIALPLAESRVRKLNDEYENLCKEYDVLAEKVRLSDVERRTSVDRIDNNKSDRINSKLQLTDLAVQADKIYKKWLREKYDELSKIIPDLKDHYEAKYDEELKCFTNSRD